MFGFTAVECFVIIIAIYILVYWLTPRKGAWFPMLLVVILLSVLAYYSVPNETDDLTRYFKQLEYLKIYGHDYLTRCFDEDINGWGTYRVAGYYFYFISKFPDVYWLPTVTVFIVYGLMFLVMYKVAQRFEVNKLYLFAGTMIFISMYWFYDTYSGIRNGLAFAIILACAYYQLVERKRIPLCMLGYVLACLLHSAGIIFVLMVAVAMFTLNTSGKFIKVLLVFGVAMGNALFQYLASITDNSFVQSVAEKVEKNSAVGSLYTGVNFLVNISAFIFLALIMIYLGVYILEGEYSNELKRFYKLACIFIYFLFGCVLNTLVFMRLSRWLIPIIGAIVYMIGMQVQNNQFNKYGMAYYKYSNIQKFSVRTKLKPAFDIICIGYVSVHFWYLCVGSSLCWLHF